jgi:hypothetical protein
MYAAPADLRHLPHISDIAESLSDDANLIEFDPTAPIPDPGDPNPDKRFDKAPRRNCDAFSRRRDGRVLRIVFENA